MFHCVVDSTIVCASIVGISAGVDHSVGRQSSQISVKSSRTEGGRDLAICDSDIT